MRRKILKAIKGFRTIKVLLPALILGVIISVFLYNRNSTKFHTGRAGVVKLTVSANASSEKNLPVISKKKLLGNANAVKLTVSANASSKKRQSVISLKTLFGGAIALKPTGRANENVQKGLSAIFIGKLFDLQVKMLPKTACHEMKTPLGLCQDTSCPLNFSSSPAVRLQAVLANRDSFLPRLRRVLAAMDRSVVDVEPHSFIFASAGTSHNIRELKALVSNVVKHISPRLDNFTFVIYDLGLTLWERLKIEQLCNCSMPYFPFNDLPHYFNELNCNTWKPLIVNALLKRSEFTVWMDSSVRWRSDAPLNEVFRLLKRRGVLIGISDDAPIALRTQPTTFEFYGDKACQYHAYPEMHTQFIMFHNEPFIRQAVVEPWFACAFGRECMCIPGHEDFRWCDHKLPRQEGACHRFDQSSLSIILTKLYLDRSHELKLPEGILDDRHLQVNRTKRDL